MKIAIPLFEKRVSPRFDCAQGFLLALAENDKVMKREEFPAAEGCDSPEAAAAYRGLDVALPRESLPPTRENEFYQADLIGLEVRNMDDVPLGIVAGLFSNGAHDVMRLAGDEGERLLPFIEQVVREVDIGAGRIRVDWGKDW